MAANGKPEGTITSLPGKEGKGAPETFEGDYEDIEEFLDHFEVLCDEKNVIKDEYKCKGLVRYCRRGVKETLKSLKAYTDMNYAELKKEFIEYYDQERTKQRYKLKHLRELVEKWKGRKIEDLETFKKYQLAFVRVGGWLLQHKKIVESEHRRFFWAGLHRKFRRRVEAHMRILDPTLDDSEPFEITKIAAAAKKLYNRDRFDDGEWELYGKGKKRRNETSDSESDSDRDSSESEDGSSDESERRQRRKEKEKLTKKEEARKEKKGASKVDKGRETLKRGEEKGDEIGEIVAKMSRLSIDDPTYLTMWIQLIRKAPELQSGEFLPRPAMNTAVAQSRTSPAPRVRDLPPHVTNAGGNRRDPPREYGMRCFGCGQTGHSASRCEEINKLIHEGVVERNSYNKVQWKDGTPIYRAENETLLDAIRKGVKTANLIMIARAEPTDDKYIYLQTERQESDDESENQEEVWLNATASDIFEAEAYGVQ